MVSEGKSFAETDEIITADLGFITTDTDELIAQSFGNYYYGKKRTMLAKSIVDYFMKELK